MNEERSFNESYILNESPEISVGENPHWTEKFLSSFPALKSRNYSLFFVGQLISLIGTWLQIVAEGWLVFQLTKSALYVGLDAAAATIPSLFLSLFGGVIVDRFPKKIILIFTQTSAMILAFALGLLTVLRLVNVWEIISLAFLLGVVNAIDSPARQAYIYELIDNKERLSSAIALNSGMFNAARVLGPTVAGILIAVFGAGGAFLLNGVSYIAVIIALFFINTSTKIIAHDVDPFTAIKQGLSYVAGHSTIKILLILSAVVSVFGWSYSTLMPVVAQKTFHLNAAGLGYLYAVTGVGALVSTFIISAYSKKISVRRFIIGGNILFALSLIMFSFVQNLYFAYGLLFLIGFGLVSQFAMTNTTIQHVVDDSMRGRVMSLYTLAFLGCAPFGSFEIGYLAEKLGSSRAILINALIVLAFGFCLYFKRSKLVAKI